MKFELIYPKGFSEELKPPLEQALARVNNGEQFSIVLPEGVDIQEKKTNEKDWS